MQSFFFDDDNYFFVKIMSYRKRRTGFVTNPNFFALFSGNP